MCLKKVKRITTDKDIVCYKVFLYFPQDKVLQSPYYWYFEWELGKRYDIEKPPQEELEKIDRIGKTDDEFPVYTRHCSYWMDDGLVDVDEKSVHNFAFHSYRDGLSAALHCRAFNSGLRNNFTDRKYVVARCTIPKDSKYIFEGSTGSGSEEKENGYASQSLIINDIVH